MIMESLYHGQLYPAEQIMSRDERYLALEEQVHQIAEDLYPRLNDEDRKQMEQLRDTMYASQTYAEEENFRYGLTLGIMLMREVYEIYGARYFSDDE